MTIASMIGPVDFYSAATAIAFAGGFTVIVSTQIAKYQNRRTTDQSFELEKLKLRNADTADARNQDVNREVELGKIAANRQVEIARIEGGMVDVKKSNPDG